MRILGIIPARGGSKGIPGKNVKLLAGKPLISYTIDSALASKGLAHCIVSTESPEIREFCLQAGVEVPFLRPATLAQDDTPTLPVVQHVLAYFQTRGIYYDAVCLLQPTTPFRQPGLIDAAIARFESSGADSLLSVRAVPFEYNPHWVFEPDEKGYLQLSTGEKTIIPRRQELPPAFIRDGAIYLTSASVILQGSLYGQQIAWIDSASSFYVNIDTPSDWEVAERLAPEFNRLCAV